jgi:hypothetical protein
MHEACAAALVTLIDIHFLEMSCPLPKRREGQNCASAALTPRARQRDRGPSARVKAIASDKAANQRQASIHVLAQLTVSR